MTKSELIARLAHRHPWLMSKDAELAVETIINIMSENLSKGKRIEIRQFGSFALHYRSPSMARHLKSGALFKIEGTYVPHFKPGKGLRESLNTPSPSLN